MTSGEDRRIDFTALAKDLQEALSQVLHQHGGPSIVTKYVVLVETAEAAGERPMWVLADPTAKTWEIKGMLTHALDIERQGG